MRKSYAIASAAATAVTAVFLLTLAGCDLMTGPETGQSAAQDGKAAVSLTIAGTEARTVAPTLNPDLTDVKAWRLRGTKERESMSTDLFDKPADETLYLETGTWNSFTLEGYQDEAGDTLILRGTIPNQKITLEGPNTLEFTVAPVSEGTGTVTITINLPVGHGITQAKVFKGDVDLNSPITPSGDSVVYEKTGHEAGDYYYSFRLFKGDDLYGVVSELVKVRANLTSAKTYTLTAADLNLRYAITFHLNDGAFGGDYPDSYRSTDAAVTLPTPTRDGYDFVEWHDNDGLTGDPVADIPQDSAGDKDFYAEWEIINYTINYYLYDGSNDAGNPATYTVVSPTITLNNPTRDGAFRFGGWYDDEYFKDAANTTITTGSTGERTFHARWIRQYTVTFNTYGGSGQGTTTHDEGYKVYKPTDPEKSGFKFLGWFNAEGGETKYEDWPYTLNADMTIHAHWKKIHLVTFYPVGGSPTPEPQNVVEDEKAAKPADPIKALESTPATAGLYAGQTFGGWYTEDSYSTKWDFDDPVTGPLDLHAQWTAPDSPIELSDGGGNALEKALSYINGQAAGNYTIVLEENYSMGQININKANTVITLVGKTPTTISLNNSGRLFLISGGGELVLDNNITLKGYNSNDYPLVTVSGSSSTLTMKDGATIKDNIYNSTGGGVYINAGIFNMEGGTISGNSAYSGGGVSNQQGTFNMSGGTISGNSANWGGGVYGSYNSFFYMTGGTISGNSADTQGGGVYIGTGGAVATFSKTGTSVIYGDTNKNPDDDNLTDNTAKSADSGGGHAVYFARSPTYYRDSDLLSGVGISTSDTVTNWNQ